MAGSLKYRASEHLVFCATLVHCFVALIAFAASLLLCSSKHHSKHLISDSERQRSSYRSYRSSKQERRRSEKALPIVDRLSGREVRGDSAYPGPIASPSVPDADGKDGASDHPKPRVFPMTEKQMRIEEEHETRDPSDYPTMEDIVSDWESDITELGGAGSLEKHVSATSQKQQPAGSEMQKSAPEPDLKEDATLPGSGKADASDKGDAVDKEKTVTSRTKSLKSKTGSSR